MEIKYIGYVVIGILILYVTARLITTAYFRSKSDYELGKFYRLVERKKKQPKGETKESPM